MTEETILLNEADPVLFCGVNNANIRLLRVLYPKIKIVSINQLYPLLIQAD